MLYLNLEGKGETFRVFPNLTLTSVVFEFTSIKDCEIEISHLTLTSVVFELGANVGKKFYK